jgi:hypothetical protein
VDLSKTERHHISGKILVDAQPQARREERGISGAEGSGCVRPTLHRSINIKLEQAPRSPAKPPGIPITLSEHAVRQRHEHPREAKDKHAQIRDVLHPGASEQRVRLSHRNLIDIIGLLCVDVNARDGKSPIHFNRLSLTVG